MNLLNKSLLFIIFIAPPVVAWDRCHSDDLNRFFDMTTIDHVRYVPTPIERIYISNAFVASVDSYDDDNDNGLGEYLGVPNWVATHIFYDKVLADKKLMRSPSRWYRSAIFDEERDTFDINKSLDHSYKGSGWQRGHLAKKSDAKMIGQYAPCQTFVFANAVPMAGELNEGIWLGLENYISTLAKEIVTEGGEGLWVVAGPIFNKRQAIDFIGADDEVPVAIPDAIFKVVFLEKPLSASAFIFDNKFLKPPKNYKSGKCDRDKNYDYRKNLTSVNHVERLAGLSFNLPMNISKRIEPLPKINKADKIGGCI